MKILFVNKFLYTVGGCENYMIELAKTLNEQGHETQFFGCDSEKKTLSNEFGIYVKSYDDKKIFNPFTLVYNKKAGKQLSKLLDLYKPDIVHMNNISYHLTSSVIDACKKKKVPVVMTVHDPQLVCPNHMLYRFDTKEICDECIQKKSFKPCLEHKCLKGSFLKSYLGYKESIRTHKLDSYSYISKLICPSEFIQSKLIAGGYSKEQTMVLRNFSNVQKSDKKISKQDYVLFFGRLSEEKGIDVLLKAMPDDIKLIIAGTGPLADMIKKVNKSNISYVGFKSGDELKKLIQGARFSIYPSKWYENCPLSIFESITLGTPVIAANQGGNVELIDDGINGVLYENCNVEDLNSKITALYNNSPLLEKMYANCANYKRVPSKEEYYHQIMSLYEEWKNEKTN